MWEINIRHLQASKVVLFMYVCMYVFIYLFCFIYRKF